jgi:hypothetical protein
MEKLQKVEDMEEKWALLEVLVVLAAEAAWEIHLVQPVVQQIKILILEHLM